ncbi:MULTISPECIES: KPN_02809 family neutral zinc metallopeptidase [Sorangium]|uniref:Neutral zinc metallopeptidase n=1 Tax=Sorangium cellulosum (strain So ce56) TaxID=448385 RepID=A9EZA6_SORC5|nr:neutral zinc metallopeptidase [Sorangium cellulosum]CAN97617.1 putative neutral zinc metallopeptidase [Sorangium cellulosum So ce56]
MRWTPGKRSENLRDLRGASGGAKLGVGGTVILLVLSLVFGKDLLSGLGQGSAIPGAQSGRSSSPEEERLVDFVSFVLDDTEAVWTQVFSRTGQRYPAPVLTVFTDSVRSGCGVGESAMGPFYCPADRTAYIDLGFYRELKARFGAPGDFAQAYVLAHEIGHHVQNVLGTERRLRQLQAARPGEKNALSVKMELQADCFAGVWAHSTQKRDLLEAGDVEEALRAASAIGDDRLQKAATGRVNPETWTHGSSAQRVAWFKRGMQGGRVEDCDTFAEGSP